VKRQSKSWWCGVAAIANALEVLGIRRSQREIARSCAVTEVDGTDETEMKRALLANGMHIDEACHQNWEKAADWLSQSLGYGRPVILCCDSDEHWVTAIGTCGSAFLLFDPSRNHGVEVHTADSLCERWANDYGEHYGIAVGRPA
jgi:ABC-type bacteriocin/lantibiotic exporter with double-glycine peptidase domain